jgi:hypothetical protein
MPPKVVGAPAIATQGPYRTKLNAAESIEPSTASQAENHNPVAVAATIKDLTLEYAVEAARIASIAAIHFVENTEIGRLLAVDADMACACRHLSEAAALFRKWQGPTKGAAQ